MTYNLQRCDGTHPDFYQLILELDRELRSFTTDHDDLYITHNIVPDNVKVTLIHRNGQAVGCACLREYDRNSVELKRMYVRPEHRRKGVSRMILEDLEEWARNLGYRRILLETGEVLKEAHGLYRSSGFVQIENYSPYEGIAESVCFEKKLN